MKMIAVVAFAMGVSTLSHAAGFEKAVMWSGKEAGYASSGQSKIVSSESLYFNPAGLAGGEESDVTLDVSPTNLRFEAPIAASTSKEQTDHNGAIPGAFFAKYKVNERLGVGAGVYLGAGSQAVYDDVNLSVDSAAITYSPRIRTEIKVIEYSLGAGYEVAPGFRLGAAWRIAHVNGSFSTIKKTVTNTAYSFFDVDNAKQTKYGAYRLGAQYDAPDHRWGVGATYRSGIDFVAGGLGSATTTVIPTRTTTPGTVGTAILSTSLPQAFGLGGNVALGEDFRLLGDIDMVKYSKNKALGIQASINGTAVPNLDLNWKDMYVYRIGGEYTGVHNVRLKAGFALTSQVTPNGDARSTIAPPGVGHTFTVGAGTSFHKLDLDGAFEYARTTGSGQMTGTPAGSTTKELITSVDSEYKARVMAFHAAATYRF